MNDINSPFEDRVFSLSSGEKVDPAILEKQIEKVCHYVKYVAVTRSGESPVALIFPNRNLLSHPDFKVSPEEGCFCPRSLNELGKCLTGCLQKVNRRSPQKLKSAAIINSDNEVHYSVKRIIEKYRGLLNNMYAGDVHESDDIYVVKLDK